MATNNWTDILHTGDAIDVLYVDFKKAFYLVPHVRLLKKLDAYGIRGKLWNWIKAPETDSVTIILEWCYPQGSVLSPLFS